MSKSIRADRLADIIEPNQLVFIPGAIGVPIAFLDDLMGKPDRSRSLRILTSIAPGIKNPLDVDRLNASARVTGLFMQPGLTAAQRSGRYRALPMSYGGFVRYLLDHVEIDVTVLQVSPPDSKGLCSLGASVEFTPAAVKKSRQIVGLINPNMPRIPGAVTLPLNSFDYICDVDTPLPEYSTETDAATDVIADHIARQVTDGCILQTGLGKVPTALSARLRSHRKLRFVSGMLSDGLMELAEAGALDMDFRHTTCAVAGTKRLYDWSEGFQQLRVLGCEFTHDPGVLRTLDRFTAINSALEVDLFGQCNLEHADGKAVSGAGGAPDFARAARLSPGGCSIVALNATHRRGQTSRIVPCFSNCAIASLSRVDVDLVITEFGVADLRGASVHERAEAIIAIAAPDFRGELLNAWKAIAAKI